MFIIISARALRFPSSPTQRLAEPRKSEPLPKGGDPTRKRPRTGPGASQMHL